MFYIKYCKDMVRHPGMIHSSIDLEFSYNVRGGVADFIFTMRKKILNT